MYLDPAWIKVSGILISALASFIALIAWKQSYFANGFDLFWHATVILDILLESLLISDHDHFGFYFCALAFIIVVGGYHRYRLIRDPIRAH